MMGLHEEYGFTLQVKNDDFLDDNDLEEP